MGRNLLRNPSFEKGKDAPAGWDWVVVAGGPVWEFDRGREVAGKRSIRILQDGRSAHGEFRQRVACKGRARYRLQARIRFAVEGTGSQSGANLYLRSFRGGRQIHDMWFRPFFVGREDWTLWSMEYVTPARADALLVSFDMRCSCGVAWFDGIELFEVPEPLVRSAGCAAAVRVIEPPFRRVESAAVLSDAEPGWLISEVLRPLLGDDRVHVVRRPADLRDLKSDAAVILQHGKSPVAGFNALEEISRKKLVVMTPRAFAGCVGGAVRCETVQQRLLAPCARIGSEGFLTRGFAAGDVIPWQRPDGRGGFAQDQVRARPQALRRLGFEVVASSACGAKAADGHPLILRRGGHRGGIVVMDLDMLNSRPTFLAETNLACLIFTNALGRPQTSFGRFVYPGHPLFSYDRFCEELHAVARSHPAIRVREEGRSAAGRPIYSLAVGPEDAPAFYVDCAIHSDEWAPSYGAVLYAANLATANECAQPWARALLRELCFKCIPVLSPDGWDGHARFIRAGLDLNRNFPTHWDGFSGKGKGSAALSEPEARVVAGVFARDKVVAAVNWHETTADTNWVGFPRASGRYARYAAAVPAVFRQVIDGRWFSWQAAAWTQISNPRNFHFHHMDSFPYVRDYSPQHVPYELHYADSLGIDGLTVEQYGNGDLAAWTSPQRTEVTGRIIEMLFGLQIGLVCRNPLAEPLALSVPLAAGGSRGSLAVYDGDGAVLRKALVSTRSGTALVRAELPPKGAVVVELDPAPWKQR